MSRYPYGNRSKPNSVNTTSHTRPAPETTGSDSEVAEEATDYHSQSTTEQLQLFTPSAAADILAIKESWLRRKAGTRSIPCTFVGRHLRFSVRDLGAIAEQGAKPVARRRGRPRKWQEP